MISVSAFFVLVVCIRILKLLKFAWCSCAVVISDGGWPLVGSVMRVCGCLRVSP